MKRLIPLITAALLAASASAQPLTTAFTFQGQLSGSGAPANGTYDVRFHLYDALTAGNQIGPTLCTDNVAVANGLFTTQLDFGAQFAGQQRYLEIDVRPDTGLPCSNSTGFTTLGPRQALTAAPNADFALSAATAASATTATTATTATNATQLNGQSAAFYTNAANLTGSLPSADLTGSYSLTVNLTNANNHISGTFTGNGAGLTNVPWSGIASAPNFALLQPDLSSTQTGNIRLSGNSRVASMISDGPSRVGMGGTFGDLLQCGDNTLVPTGLTLETDVDPLDFPGPILNLDTNFRFASRNTNSKGGALRLDGRANYPTFQFLTRPAGGTVEYNALTIGGDGAVILPNESSVEYPLTVDGHVSVAANGLDGSALVVGEPSFAMQKGITTENGQNVLNFDLNFRTDRVAQNFRGAAVRLDPATADPAIQFLTRPAGSSVESIPMAIRDDGLVYVGAPSATSCFFNAADGGSPRTYTAVFEATGSTGRAVLATSTGSFGLVATNSNTTGTALSATATAGSGASTGLLASNASTGGTALLAQENATSGFNFAVHAISNSPNAQTIYAESTATSGAPMVVHALNRSNSGYAGYFEGPSPYVASFNNTGSGRGLLASSPTDAAVWAQSSSGAGLHATCSSGNAIIATSDSNDCIVATTNGSSKTAVNGFANQPGSTGGYFSSSATSGSGNGVVGVSNSPSAYAVYALGRFAATGTKAFQIDHPDDPSHKYLLHYCTESPEAINFYRGTVTLNQQGEATIDLPPYFAKINKDPSYQLTALGSPMPLLHVSQEISPDALAQGEKAGPDEHAPICSFTISGGAPNAKVCWRIECLRNDRWIQVHGAPVEVNKQGPQDGTYQHPDLYNQPAEMGLNFGPASR